MFDLDKSIAAWRRSLEHNHSFSVDDIDELEQHIRDQVADLTSRGQTVSDAFHRAMADMGDYAAAEREYGKIFWAKRRRQGRLIEECILRMNRIGNYVKSAWRSLNRRKGIAAINLAGLTAGLFCCLVIFQYVAFEQSFDTFHEHAASLYRVTEVTDAPGRDSQASGLTAHGPGPALADAVSDVTAFARMHPDYLDPIVAPVDDPGRAFEEQHVFFVDRAFLDMFTYPLVEGRNDLDRPDAALISASTARKYFGDASPMGRVLKVDGWISSTFTVAGVFEDVPLNSHLQFDVLLPVSRLLQESSYSDDNAWTWTNFSTYVQLRPDADIDAVERAMTNVLYAHRGEAFRQSGATARFELQPVTDIHLNANVDSQRIREGNHRNVYFFSVIGFVTLFIALINYVNLSTARILDRAREVGVRKVVGAQRLQLLTQFLLESAMTNAAAFVLAIGLTAALQPAVNHVAGTTLTAAVWTNPWFWILSIATFVAATLLAGAYPAYMMSGFRPAAVLKGKAMSGRGGSRLRKSLVVVQFATSVVLVAGTILVYAQLRYMRAMDLGLDVEQVVVIPGPKALGEDVEGGAAIRTLIQEIENVPGITATATSNTVPGQGFDWYSVMRLADQEPDANVEVVLGWIDSSFVSMYGLELVAGTGFQGITNLEPEGEPRRVIANVTATEALGFDRPEEAIDKVVWMGGAEGRIVGVFRDFNWSSAHTPRENVLFGLTETGSQISLRVSPSNVSSVLGAVETAYTSIFPGNPFRYAFVDEQFDLQYREDRRFAALFSFFAAMAVTIACLGLFGLAAHAAQHRRKEIGVRKAMGATVASVVVLLVGDFLKLVGVAFVVAVPLAWLLMDRWLDAFAFRTAVRPEFFLATGMIVFLVALMTTGYQSIRAARADPAHTLRYE